ncbi:MAG: prolipoprotein diacylglyceryl transferase [Clostridia bacterium]|nr:prolipoprotein diacylglyceryl transferase [Clostridia bacterium]
MGTLLLAKSPQWGLATDGRGFYVFGFEIYFYAICIVCGMIAAAALAALLMKRRNMAPDFIFTLFVFCIPAAIIGARFFSCITDPNLGIARFFDFRDGGLSITGGVIGGVGAGLVVCLVKKVNFLRAADCVVICILLGQAVGRLGNYFNQEVFGAEVTNPSLQWAPFAVYINDLGGWYYAFCFYEMFINLIGFALLYAAAWFWKKKPNGIFTCLYFVWYGTVRACMEPYRYEAYILDKGGIMWSEVLWILLLAGGLVGIAILLFVNYRKEGALFGSKKGDPCGITKFLSPNKNEQPYYSKINIFGLNYPLPPLKEEKQYQKMQKKADRLTQRAATEEEKLAAEKAQRDALEAKTAAENAVEARKERLLEEARAAEAQATHARGEADCAAEEVKTAEERIALARDEVNRAEEEDAEVRAILGRDEVNRAVANAKRLKRVLKRLDKKAKRLEEKARIAVTVAAKTETAETAS